MAVFPESNRRKPLHGYENTPVENVKRTEMEAGNSFMRDTWGVVRFQAVMEFRLRPVDGDLLWSWWLANRTASSFTFFDFEMSSWTSLQIATGDGTNSQFYVPGKEIDDSDFAVFVSGAARTHTTQVGVGTSGEDLITIGGAIPAAAAPITITGRFRRRYTCEMAETPTRRSTNFNQVSIGMRVRQKFPIVGLG